jgi:hypothetical protein
MQFPEQGQEAPDWGLPVPSVESQVGLASHQSLSLFSENHSTQQILASRVISIIDIVVVTSPDPLRPGFHFGTPVAGILGVGGLSHLVTIPPQPHKSLFSFLPPTLVPY